MMIGEIKLMKYLKIEDNRGFFLRIAADGGADTWSEIDQIGKDDLFALLNKAISEEFEMDEFNEDVLSNKAHQIIYKNLYEKFLDLLTNKTRFKDESESLYKAAIEKYSTPE